MVYPERPITMNEATIFMTLLISGIALLLFFVWIGRKSSTQHVVAEALETYFYYTHDYLTIEPTSYHSVIISNTPPAPADMVGDFDERPIEKFREAQRTLRDTGHNFTAQLTPVLRAVFRIQDVHRDHPPTYTTQELGPIGEKLINWWHTMPVTTKFSMSNTYDGSLRAHQAMVNAEVPYRGLHSISEDIDIDAHIERYEIQYRLSVYSMMDHEDYNYRPMARSTWHPIPDPNTLVEHDRNSIPYPAVEPPAAPRSSPTTESSPQRQSFIQRITHRFR